MNRKKRPIAILFSIALLAPCSCGFVLPYALSSDQEKSSDFYIPTQSVTPYIPEDLGIVPEPADSPAARLPVISDSERAAIKTALVYMEEQGMMTDQYWKKSSRSARTVLFQEPLSSSDLDSEIDSRFEGGSFPQGSAPASLATVLDLQSSAADEFFGKMVDAFPSLTNNQLINLRMRLTVSLVFIRLGIDYRDKEQGLPEELLVLFREKTVAARMKINEELIRRGVTSL